MNDNGNSFVEVMPEGSLEILSQQEVQRLRRTGEARLHEILRRCSLAVLNWGSVTDSALEVLDEYKDFDIEVVQRDHGVTLALKNAPQSAFVGGQMIRGIRELLFAVLRDVVFTDNEVALREDAAGGSSEAITTLVFEVLRNARILRSDTDTDLVVCWGGHAIGRGEYDYTKEVGYQLGLRQLNVCTGCGPGAMKGPMKGAAIGHSKQRVPHGRYVGVSEPGIIAAEPPNPIVNELVIMPDMEKRLEAFVRIAHAIVVFPGGVGTAEEILYLLGVLLHPDNRDVPMPVFLTGPRSSEDYFRRIDAFVRETLGADATERYKIVTGDPVEVASQLHAATQNVGAFRRSERDAFFFNWRLRIGLDFQEPFSATHEAMSTLEISRSLPAHELAANLRRAFSGMVAGNIRDEGIRAIERHGPFEISGERDVMRSLDELLSSFIAQHRMRLPGKPYTPCYRVIT